MPTHSIIVDLEATCCDQGSFPREEMEIIEIGAVCVLAQTGEIVAEFQTFIRPVRNPKLTDFCTSLTTITQMDVDGGATYPVALEHFSGWLAQWPEQDFCSWGEYDRNQFLRDCEFHDLAYPFQGEHRNLKKEFSATRGGKKRFGLGQAICQIGLEFDGTAHRGIDDARNIARVYAHLLGKSRKPR